MLAPHTSVPIDLAGAHRSSTRGRRPVPANDASCGLYQVLPACSRMVRLMRLKKLVIAMPRVIADSCLSSK